MLQKILLLLDHLCCLQVTLPPKEPGQGSQYMDQAGGWTSFDFQEGQEI